ncbi:uncharacterized protein LOC133533976 [Cydia pomonella]|uniref:uncharacterized protein LOC133533976 n=1 Tax=Cydia pomonella TaxID=82600 RepID=UPI002ADDC02D|nr:uncharacterized protein LOC133533976 [Cydia pomonella]
MTSVLKCNACNIVIDELLCYIQNKLSVIDDDTLVRLCRTSFSSEEIKKSKCLLFDSVSTNQRKISRKNSGKEVRDLEDIVALLRSVEIDKVPVFVARKLESLPPITVDHLDCTKLLKDLAKIQNDIALVKSSYATITQLEELRFDLNNMKCASIPLSPFSKVNARRGAWVYDSGPIGLSHCSTNSEKENSSTSHVSPTIPLNNDNINNRQPSPKEQSPLKNIQVKCSNNNEIAILNPLSSVEVSHPPLTEIAKPCTQADNECGNTRRAVTDNSDYPRDHDNNSENGEWITKTYKRNKPNYRYAGKRGLARDAENNAKFRAAERKVPIFISNVNKECLESDIINYVKDKTQENIMLEKLNIRKNSHNAFKFFISESKESLFLDAKIWPQGIVFKRFVHFRQGSTNRKLSVDGTHNNIRNGENK